MEGDDRHPYDQNSNPYGEEYGGEEDAEMEEESYHPPPVEGTSLKISIPLYGNMLPPPVTAPPQDFESSQQYESSGGAEYDMQDESEQPYDDFVEPQPSEPIMAPPAKEMTAPSVIRINFGGGSTQTLSLAQEPQKKQAPIQPTAQDPVSSEPPQIPHQPVKIVLGGLKPLPPKVVPPPPPPQVEIVKAPDLSMTQPLQIPMNEPAPSHIFQPMTFTQPPLAPPMPVQNEIPIYQPPPPLIQQQQQPVFLGEFTNAQEVSRVERLLDSTFQGQQQQDVPYIIPDHQQQQEVKPVKAPKQKKVKKIKGKGSLTQFYDLQKVKVTMELDPTERRGARGQSVFKFTLKSDEEIAQMLESLSMQGNFKKYQLDLKLHAKQILIDRIALLTKSPEGNVTLNNVAMEYLDQDKQQPLMQQQTFGNISRDLYTFESVEQRDHDQQLMQPQLVAKKIVSFSFKKESLKDQLPQTIQLLVKYYLKSITDFGIHAVTYKKPNSMASFGGSQTSTYFHTSDHYESQALWMPIVQGSFFVPLAWSFKYIVPSTYTVVASGHLYSKQVEAADSKRALFHYKLKDGEMAPAAKLGFLVGEFPEIQILTELPQVELAHAFFTSPDKHSLFNQGSKFFEKHIASILQYLQTKLICEPYPFRSLKLVFLPNLFLKDSRKQSLDYFGGLHLLDEELLFPRNLQEGRHRAFKHLACAIAFDYFGGRVYEESPDDLWLLLGIRESIGNHFKILKCGVLLYRYHIMKTIDSVYRKAKHGFERNPVHNANVLPNELLLNELVYEKCELIMHMLESMIDKSYFEKILRELYRQAAPLASTALFKRIFKQVCGFKLKQFAQNWLSKTSCPKLTVQYCYNKKNNSLDLTLTQESAAREGLTFRSRIQEALDSNELLTRPFLRKDPLHMSSGDSPASKTLRKIEGGANKFAVELRRCCGRWFEGEVNVMLYLTDGADISTQQQKMSLKHGENQVSINIPLAVKVKKTIQNKKKEYESLQLHEDDEDDEDEASHDKAKAGLLDNNTWKFGMNDYELEDYPITTKTIFDVKNLESSVLWIRVDPDMEYIRRVKVRQEPNNWLFQLLLEKDIIGQIEAVRQVYKQRPQAQQQFAYEILQAVSTHENYFFKVRKLALKYLQRMLTSQFNEYLSHEKFLIKVFNQRNFDSAIGFYRSNDFSRVLEYPFDKQLLRTLGRCKEMRLHIQSQILDKVASIIKPPQSQEPGSISISVAGSDLAQVRVQNAPREHLLRMSSDAIASLLMKLLLENDNSENPFEDCGYLKTILKALGSLDNLKAMPDIAKEIYRQFKLDHLGRFSAQFAITRGAIAGFFNMRKQIHIFEKEKQKLLDSRFEDVDAYVDQIKATQDVLEPMDRELHILLQGETWPYEVRLFTARYRIKHCFLYEGNSFLKALYIQLKVIDNFQAQRRIRDATEYCRLLALFFEDQVERLDFREALLDNPRSQAIVEVIWGLMCMPFNYLDCSFTYWLKRVYHFLYGTGLPPFLRGKQAGRPQELVEYDGNWAGEQAAEGLAKGRVQIKKSLDIKRPEMSIDTKLKIVLPQSLGESLRVAPPQTWVAQHQTQYSLQQQWPSAQGGSIKIPISTLEKNYSGKDFRQQEFEEESKMKLMQGDQVMAQHDDGESVYDEFADFVFTGWLQKIWDITGHLWYHEESQAFLEPVSRDDLGNYFDYYLSIIDYPMDLTTIKEKIKAGHYESVVQWRNDVETMFKNCRTFNEETSGVYESATKLQRFYFGELHQYGLYDQSSTIRVIR